MHHERRAVLRALFVAPAIIRTPGLLMPIKPQLDSRQRWNRWFISTRYMSIEEFIAGCDDPERAKKFSLQLTQNNEIALTTWTPY